MLKDLIDAFEELKKYVYIIDRSPDSPIIIKFRNEHFYHLVGLHKINFDMFFPEYMKSKDKKYKHMKKNIDKYNNILINQISDKNLLELRIKTFPYILKLLNENSNNTNLYDLKIKTPGSMYNGDYGLFKIFEEIYCLLGLKCDDIEKNVCAPQSWMASNRLSKLISNKPPKYFNKIVAIPVSIYNDDYKYE